MTVAVTYADRRALAPRARLIADAARGARRGDGLRARARRRPHRERGPAATSTAACSSRAPAPSRPTRAWCCSSRAGERGEAETIGIEIARLLARGTRPDEIAIVAPPPGERRARCWPPSCGDLGIPVALEASLPLAATAVGGALIALCRAAGDETAVGALLTHLRLDPAAAPGAVDTVEARIRRGDATTVAEAVAHWEQPAPPPRPPARGRQRRRAGCARWRRSARELAEAPHRKRGAARRRGRRIGGVPFSPLELRAGVAAAELLDELAALGELPAARLPTSPARSRRSNRPRCAQWRGPADRAGAHPRAPTGRGTPGPGPCSSPRSRTASFPSAAPPDPLLSEERRRADREPGPSPQRPGRRGALPLPRLRLAADRAAVPELAGLRRGRHRARPLALRRRGPRPARDPGRGGRTDPQARARSARVLSVDEATTERELARALAARRLGPRPRRALLGEAGLRRARRRGRGVVRRRSRTRTRCPARSPCPPCSRTWARAGSSAPTRSRAGSTCSYRWFVDHELRRSASSRIADPLWLGSLVHDALERLYREPPGEDAIPRPGDVGRWRERFAELLDEVAAAPRPGEPRAPRGARAREGPGRRLPRGGDRERDRDAPAAGPARGRLRPFDEDGEAEEQVAARDGPRASATSACAGGSTASTSPKPGARRSRLQDRQSVPPADKFAERGTLQIQLYMRVAERILGLDPVGGLYQPLGASGTNDRKPRGARARARRARRPRDRQHRSARGRGVRAGARPGRGDGCAGRRARCAPERSAAARSAASARSTAPSSRSAGSSAPSAPARRRTVAESIPADS